MFDSLRKKFTKVLVVEDRMTEVMGTRSLTTSIKEYPAAVLAIHNEFENAADNLLAEAKVILVEAEKANISKVSRLESLGFRQSKQVVETKPLMIQASLSKEQIELVAYYRTNYPNQKFITEEQVKAICYKYNLVCGDVDRFKGFVPEKNLKEIETFKLKDNEKNMLGLYKDNTFLTYVDNSSVFGTYGLNQLETVGEVYYKGAGLIVHRRDVKSNIAPGFEDVTYTKIRRVSSSIFKICAPIKDMDISNLELEDGYRLKEKKMEIPDPVVLQAVKGGFLVLTCWGDEASDPILVNENHN